MKLRTIEPEESFCSNCRHLLCLTADNLGVPLTGECHRHAPKPETLGRITEVFWPTVKGDDFCGEWAPQPKAQRGGA